MKLLANSLLEPMFQIQPPNHENSDPDEGPILFFSGFQDTK
jgi:hypothetical protein